jgi:hypothetical protein
MILLKNRMKQLFELSNQNMIQPLRNRLTILWNRTLDLCKAIWEKLIQMKNTMITLSHQYIKPFGNRLTHLWNRTVDLSKLMIILSKQKIIQPLGKILSHLWNLTKNLSKLIFNRGLIPVARMIEAGCRRVWIKYFLPCVRQCNLALKFLGTSILSTLRLIYRLTQPYFSWMKYLLFVSLGRYGKFYHPFVRVYISNGGLMQYINNKEENVFMNNNSKYGIVIKNEHLLQLVLKIMINGEQLGSVILEPKSSYHIKTPVKDDHQFQFVSPIPPKDTRVHLSFSTVITKQQAQQQKQQEQEILRQQQQQQQQQSRYGYQRYNRVPDATEEKSKEREEEPQRSVVGTERIQQRVLASTEVYTNELFSLVFNLKLNMNKWAM